MFQALSTPCRTLSKVLLCSIIALSIAPAKPASAAELCAGINTLLVRAHSNFSKMVVDPTGPGMPQPLPGAEKCTMARTLSGANTYHCAWEFSYRNAAANALFERFSGELPDCLGGNVEMVKDQDVNHPDYYDQRQYHLDQVTVTVSIKDKSALQRTYVFLGVHGAIPDK